MDISNNTDFTKLTDAELLRFKEKWAITLDSEIYKKIVDEICRRQSVKEKKHDETQQKNEKTQRDIVIMTGVIIILTIIILGFTVAQYYKSPVINHIPTDNKPIKEAKEPQSKASNK